MSGSDTQDPPSTEPKEEAQPNGLQCFLDESRECGPDCMGYVMENDLIEKSTILSPQQKNCIFIISVERLGRYIGAGVTMMHKDRADLKRVVQPTPPDPRGTK